MRQLPSCTTSGLRACGGPSRAECTCPRRHVLLLCCCVTCLSWDRCRVSSLLGAAFFIVRWRIIAIYRASGWSVRAECPVVLCEPFGKTECFRPPPSPPPPSPPPPSPPPPAALPCNCTAWSAVQCLKVQLGGVPRDFMVRSKVVRRKRTLRSTPLMLCFNIRP